MIASSVKYQNIWNTLRCDINAKQFDHGRKTVLTNFCNIAETTVIKRTRIIILLMLKRHGETSKASMKNTWHRWPRMLIPQRKTNGLWTYRKGIVRLVRGMSNLNPILIYVYMNLFLNFCTNLESFHEERLFRRNNITMNITWYVTWMSRGYHVKQYHVKYHVNITWKQYHVNITLISRETISHEYHVNITWMSRECPREYHVNITWNNITWISREYHVICHVKQYHVICHVNITWNNITWISREYHVNITWISREYHVNVMWISRETISREYHVNMTWMSCEYHVKQYHVNITWNNITWISREYHVNVTWI